MATAAPPPSSPAGTPPAWADAVLAAALAAQREDGWDALLRRRPVLARGLARRLLPAVRRLAGDAITAERDQPLGWRVLLRAALASRRPDGGDTGAPVARADWLDHAAWRPWLAVSAQAGFISVPVFADRYRPAAGESVADQLVGLWDVAPSTFYRHLERGRRLLAAAVLESPHLAGSRRLHFDLRLRDELHAQLGLADPAARRAWHARQATRALAAQDAAPALWHQWHAGDLRGLVATLHRHKVDLAAQDTTDAIVAAAQREPMPVRLRFELALAQAGLARMRGDDAAERAALDEALHVATTVGDALLLGRIYGALGKAEEARDADRAFACYQESAEFLRQAGLGDDPAAAGPEIVAEAATTLVRLAWLYVLRKDPRAEAILDRAEALRAHLTARDEVVAMLEQTWGEFWRRIGDLPRAIEAKHRALAIYERLGDRQAVLKTHSNLALLHGEARDFARAIDYAARVLQIAEHQAVEPEIVAATELNLGAVHFWQGDDDTAIAAYERALDIARRSGLKVLVGRAHYNLAEAFFRRLRERGQAADEGRGDAHVAAALEAWREVGDLAAAEATRSLKAEMLGAGPMPPEAPPDGTAVDRLLPTEFAAHVEEMREVQRHRAALALPQPPESEAAARLAIAQAYLQIAVRERESALAAIARHGLQGRFDAELQRLRETFDRALSREERLSARWRRDAADLLGAERAEALLAQLLAEGWVHKSGYAQRFGVGAATASKHLARLARLGLVEQTGKGPSTRYRLPP